LASHLDGGKLRNAFFKFLFGKFSDSFNFLTTLARPSSVAAMLVSTVTKRLLQ
jgi:hypothetical protein